MIEIVNLMITWLISVCLATVIGYFYAKNKFSGKKKTVITEKAVLTPEEVYEREKREREERNFFNYDGTEQDDSNV